MDLPKLFTRGGANGPYWQLQRLVLDAPDRPVRFVFQWANVQHEYFRTEILKGAAVSQMLMQRLPNRIHNPFRLEDLKGFPQTNEIREFAMRIALGLEP